jgi:hypothetical protein
LSRQMKVTKAKALNTSHLIGVIQEDYALDDGY